MFLIIVGACIFAAYNHDAWLPQTIDFIFQKSTPTKNITDDPNYALYEKYKSATSYSEPYEECYIHCAQDGFEGFKFCAITNKCAAIK